MFVSYNQLVSGICHWKEGIFHLNIIGVKIPTGRRESSWLFIQEWPRTRVYQETTPARWSERDLNPRPPNFKFRALTARPCCHPFSSSIIIANSTAFNFDIQFKPNLVPFRAEFIASQVSLSTILKLVHFYFHFRIDQFPSMNVIYDFLWKKWNLKCRFKVAY